MLILNKNIFTSSMMVCDKGKFAREHFTYLTIEYDQETNFLSVCGTNAQVMIINEIKIVGPQDQEFCKKAFSEVGKGYMLPASLLTDKKNLYAVFNFLDGRLMCNGSIVGIFDGVYPSWRHVIPQEKYLQKSRFYTAFNPNFVKLINKALEYKNECGIVENTPLVASVDDDPRSESLTPHMWKTIDESNQKQIVILMPLRLD